MTARDEQPEKPRGAHGWSLAHLACGLLAACSIESEPLEPVDPNDIDTDGIPNAADICPRSYDPDQHDEDLDGIGDACDVCPAIADPEQADTGELGANQFDDGVGDACDPRAATDGDRRVRFDPFFADSSATWFGEGFTIENDAARATADARFRGPNVQGDGLFAQIRVASLVWTGAGRVDVAVDGDGIAARGFRCGVTRDADADGNDEVEAVQIGGAGQIARTTLGAPVTSELTITAWRLTELGSDGRFFCRVRHGNGNQRELELPVPIPFSTGPYAFGSTGATTEISSIVVYSSPINPCAFTTGTPDCPQE